MKRSVVLVALLAALLVRADGTVHFVSADAPESGDGSSWLQAFPSLGQALAVAEPGDEVWVAGGSYTPTPGADRTASFQLPGGVSIYGGFAGNESAQEARDPTGNPTVLSGEIGDPEILSDNSFHVIRADGSTETTLLDGFTITRGQADGPTNPDQEGGGVRAVDASLIIRDCVIENNHASRFGGGAYLLRSPSSLDGCRFSTNSSGRDGGALYGAQSDLNPVDCRFLGNSVTWNGGGIYLKGGTSIIDRCRFLGNQAGAEAGAIYNESTDSVYLNSLVSGNRAGTNGGAIVLFYSSPTLTNITMSGNRAVSQGGAIFTVFSVGTFNNCIVWGNSAAGSTASASSSCYNFNGSNPTRFSHCLVGNSGGSSGWVAAVGSDRGNNLDIDPKFLSALMPQDAPDTGGDLHLMPDSPAIGAGDDLVAISALDLDGFPRVDNGDGIDLGAYEYGTDRLIPHEDTPDRHILLAKAGPAYESLLDLPDIYGVDLDSTAILSLSPNSPFVAELTSTGKLTVHPDGAVGTGQIVLRATKGPASHDLVLVCETVPPVIRVDPAATGTGDGNRWPDAAIELHQVLKTSKGTTTGPLREIWVRGGAYFPDESSETGSPFNLSEGLAIYGGFGGSEDALGQRDPAAFPTILSRNPDPNLRAPTRPIVLARSTDGRALLDGFTLAGDGPHQGTFPDYRVSAMVCDNAAPIIAGCRFLNCYAYTMGGAATCSNGASPTFVSCRFEQNLADFNGGAVQIFDSSPTFRGCFFTGNLARNTGNAVLANGSAPIFEDCIFEGNGSLSINSGTYRGGAVYNSGSTSTFLRCEFVANRASDDGGAVFNNDSTVSFMDCHFSENTGDKGGAIANLLSDLSVTGSGFDGNFAYENGGSIHLDQSESSIHDSAFSGNHARQRGGALACLWSIPEVEDCRFENNSAEDSGAALHHSSSDGRLINLSFRGNRSDGPGGAIHLTFSSPDIHGGLFLWNHAETTGGAIHADYGSGPSVHSCSMSGNSAGSGGGAMHSDNAHPVCRNTIVWDNARAGRFDLPTSSVENTNGAAPSFAFCLIAGCGSSAAWNPSVGIDAGNNLDEDPGFLVPVHQGVGPEQGADLRLRNGSVGIDAGDFTGLSAPTDLLGQLRVQGGQIDLGALEGGHDVSFLVLYPELLKGADENANGIDNFLEYALGANPAAPPLKELQPTFWGSMFTFGLRFGASDFSTGVIRSTDLHDWLPLQPGDVLSEGSVERLGAREVRQLRVDLSDKPRLFLRQEFEPSP